MTGKMTPELGFVLKELSPPRSRVDAFFFVGSFC